MTEELLKVSIPSTQEDFLGLSVLATLADHHSATRTSQLSKSSIDLCYRSYQRHKKENPQRLRLCRVIKSPSSGEVLAACQLQTMRVVSTVSDNKAGTTADTEVFIEWIACHPDAQGRGLGSQLLNWASSFAEYELKKKKLALFVVAANKSAIKFYKKRGYLVDGKKESPNRSVLAKCSGKLSAMTAWPCRHWIILKMEKDFVQQ